MELNVGRAPTLFTRPSVIPDLVQHPPLRLLDGR
ncbi:hypothetical protein FHY02_003557 [Sphingomonas sp. BK069]|nr:hypothetical protein [Sphingomonas sp. BK069]